MERFLTVAFIVTMVAACAVQENANESQTDNLVVNSQFEKFYQGNGIAVIKDKDEGCEYITYYGDAIYPRMKANGNQKCENDNAR